MTLIVSRMVIYIFRKGVITISYFLFHGIQRYLQIGPICIYRNKPLIKNNFLYDRVSIHRNYPIMIIIQISILPFFERLFAQYFARLLFLPYTPIPSRYAYLYKI